MPHCVIIAVTDNSQLVVKLLALLDLGLRRGPLARVRQGVAETLLTQWPNRTVRAFLQL